MQNQNTSTTSTWINPANALRISNNTVSFSDYKEFESLSSAIDNDLSRILKEQQPSFFKSGRPTITIGNDSYNYNSLTSKWFCSNSPSWYRRNIECYVALNSKLSNITAAAIGVPARWIATTITDTFTPRLPLLPLQSCHYSHHRHSRNYNPRPATTTTTTTIATSLLLPPLPQKHM